MNAEKLRTNLKTVRDQITKQQGVLSEKPDDFSARLLLQSLQAHHDDLRNQLQVESRLHQVELIELHLTGNNLEEGKIRLSLLARLSEHFGRAIQTASTRIHTGRDYKRTPAEVTRLLNLSFASIQPGSTKLFISADASPNLFGDSLSESTLKATFSILAKSTFEELIEEMDVVGIRSLKNLHDLFADVLRDDLELNLKWRDMDANEYAWSGTADRLRDWKKRIENIHSQDKGEVSVTGVVSLLARNGRFEILLDDGRKLKAVFPFRLLEKIREVTVDDRVTCRLRQRLLIDISHGREAMTYTVLNVQKEKRPTPR